MRRGRGASDGDYAEGYDCSASTLASGVERGLTDIDAALAFTLAQSWADRRRFVIGGMSRGGFLSVLYPSSRRLDVKGVINFAGGWTVERCDRVTHFNEESCGRAGRWTLPMLWLYSENDRNCSATAIRAYHRAFTSNGGAADLRIFPPIGHDGHILLPPAVAVWRHDVAEFLKRIGLGD